MMICSKLRCKRNMKRTRVERNLVDLEAREADEDEDEDEGMDQGASSS